MGHVFFAVFACVYMLPTLVALSRPHWPFVAVVNLFLGWTVVGWFVALLMAVTHTHHYPHR